MKLLLSKYYRLLWLLYINNKYGLWNITCFCKSITIFAVSLWIILIFRYKKRQHPMLLTWQQTKTCIVQHNYIVHKYRCYWILTNYFDKEVTIYLLVVIAYTISNLVSPSSFNDRVSLTNTFIPNIIYKIFVRRRMQYT